MADWVSVDEAAEQSGYSKEQIRRLIRGGVIKAKKQGSMWWIDRQSLQEYVEASKESDDCRRGPHQK